ncbi:hypothetical protein HJC23_004605 [Cyclotella cryptica]|uniref:Uncharacterized protein n=1 Tax=Cyclotella cryptica TaxID=29204 RepID=A0ABD3QF77_9STRA
MAVFVMGFLCINDPLTHVLASLPASSSADALEAARFEQLPPTVFAPGGRLHGVERVARESSPPGDDESSCAVIALRCCSKRSRETEETDLVDDAVNGPFAVVSGIGAISPFLHRDEACDTRQDSKKNEGGCYLPLVMEYDESSNLDSHPTPISVISPSIVVGVGGKGIDSAVLLRRAAEVCSSMYKSDNGGVEWFMSHSLEGINENFSVGPIGGAARVETSTLARRIADLAQSSTQSLGGKSGRMLSSSLLVVGPNEERTNNDDYCGDDDFVIWRVDPTGQFWKLDASAVGRAAINVESELLDKVRKWMKNNNKQTDSEEPEVDISNADTNAYLSSLSVEEAVTVANDCLVNGIMSSMKRNNQNSDGLLDNSIIEKALRRRLKTTTIRPGPFGVSNPYIELISG